jgi:hypothetical protein
MPFEHMKLSVIFTYISGFYLEAPDGFYHGGHGGTTEVTVLI